MCHRVSLGSWPVQPESRLKLPSSSKTVIKEMAQDPSSMDSKNAHSRINKNPFAASLLTLVGAIALNIVVGHLVQRELRLPLFLDSIGTILVAALLGPLPASLVGVLSNLIWATVLGVPEILPFSLTALVIGLASGVAIAKGAFSRLWRV